MAHFAELDSDNKVLRVIVISNVDVTRNGGDYSTQAETMVETRMGGSWKQCSYNHNQRGRYPGIGWTWNESKEVFQRPKPYDSWTWTDSENDWVAPVAKPPREKWQYTIGSWASEAIPDWNEDNNRWQAAFSDNEGGSDVTPHTVTIKYWDPSDSSWKNT